MPLALALAAAALTACDPAWDGPGLLGARADVVFAGAPDGWGAAPEPDSAQPSVPDTSASFDIQGPADVPLPEDVPAIEDIPADLSGPDTATVDVVPVDVSPQDTAPLPDGDAPDTFQPDTTPTPDVFRPDVEQPLCPVGTRGSVNPVVSIDSHPSAIGSWGIDLDGTGSIDNVLGPFVAFIDAQILRFVIHAIDKDWDMLAAVEHLTDDPRADYYSLALWPGESELTCEPDLTCDVVLFAEGDDPCGTPWYLDGARIESGVLVAGKFATTHTAHVIPLGESPVTLSVHALQMRAQVELEGAEVVAMSGTIAGAMRPPDFLGLLSIGLGEALGIPLEEISNGVDAIAGLMGWSESESRDRIIQLSLEFLGLDELDADIDLDQDGQPDAFSFAIRFEAGRGRAVSIVSDALPDISLDQER